jgi:hypothetical protein
MSSVTSAESESSPRPDKRPASPAQSPQPKRARPTELSLNNSTWEGGSAPTNSAEQSGSPCIQLPSIFSIENPFRGEHRLASLSTLSSELSSRGRLPSVNPTFRGLASATHTPSALSCYHFLQSSVDPDDKSSVRPKLAADTQLNLPFPDQASLPSTATLSFRHNHLIVHISLVPHKFRFSAHNRLHSASRPIAVSAIFRFRTLGYSHRPNRIASGNHTAKHHSRTYTERERAIKVRRQPTSLIIEWLIHVSPKLSPHVWERRSGPFPPRFLERLATSAFRTPLTQ